jgi:predicted nucleic acid-binding protein
MRLVADTNVFVSAALTELSWSGVVVRWLDKYGGLLKTPATEQEVFEVLRRPRMQAFSKQLPRSRKFLKSCSDRACAQNRAVFLRPPAEDVRRRRTGDDYRARGGVPRSEGRQVSGNGPEWPGRRDRLGRGDSQQDSEKDYHICRSLHFHAHTAELKKLAFLQGGQSKLNLERLKPFFSCNAKHVGTVWLLSSSTTWVMCRRG